MGGIKTSISVTILLFVNFIFAYKYLSRYSDFGLFISGIILIIQFISFWLSYRINLSVKQKNILCYVITGFIIGLVIISHIKIPVELLNVDRWSVISSFLTELFKGNYPYFAKSSMGNYPGPMPFYFFIALPFYLIGELSILSCLGYCIMLMVFIWKKRTTQSIIFLMFFLSTSLFLIWEITTRSNLFTFTVLVLLTLYAFIDLKHTKSLKFYTLAILTGLLLSTRSVYILPYIIFFLSGVINKEIGFKKLLLFISIAFISFASTFIPFIIAFKRDFFIMNPFIIQSSFLIPAFYTIIFVSISIALSFLVKNKWDKFFYSGISLFIAIVIYSIYQLVNYGYEASFINSKIDISYFVFCIPFLMMYLLEYDYNDDNKLEITNK
ncbi:MAG: hypothetical protein R6V34_01275 [Bacteroidales bacterium]